MTGSAMGVGDGEGVGVACGRAKPGTVSETRTMAATATAMATNLIASVRKERDDVMTRELVASAQVSQLDQEGEGVDAGAEALEQPPRSGGGAARCEQVVDDQHVVATADGVGVDLERIGPVFERILFAKLVVRQLSGLSNRDESGADRIRDRSAEDVSARLDPDDIVDFPAGETLHEEVDRAP